MRQTSSFLCSFLLVWGRGKLGELRIYVGRSRRSSFAPVCILSVFPQFSSRRTAAAAFSLQFRIDEPHFCSREWILPQDCELFRRVSHCRNIAEWDFPISRDRKFNRLSRTTIELTWSRNKCRQAMRLFVHRRTIILIPSIAPRMQLFLFYICCRIPLDYRRTPKRQLKIVDLAQFVRNLF